MTRKVYIRYKTRKKGGQHYHVGRKNYGLRYMNKSDMNKLINKRRKEGIIVLPTNDAVIFHDPETRTRKVIFEAGKKNYSSRPLKRLMKDLPIYIEGRHINLQGEEAKGMGTAKRIIEADPSILSMVKQTSTPLTFYKPGHPEARKCQEENLRKEGSSTVGGYNPKGGAFVFLERAVPRKVLPPKWEAIPGVEVLGTTLHELKHAQQNRTGQEMSNVLPHDQRPHELEALKFAKSKIKEKIVDYRTEEERAKEGFRRMFK